MTPYILAALMAANGGTVTLSCPPEGCVGSGVLVPEKIPSTITITGSLEYIPPTGTGEPVRLESDTIGYWLDRKRFCSPDPRTGSPMISYGDNYCHEPYEVADTVYVLRRPR